MADHRDRHGDREKMVFREFLKAAPSLAHDAHVWYKPDDEKLYDIISRSADGQTVKWQITEWLDPEQTQRSKERQNLKHAIGAAVRGLKMPHMTTCCLFPQDPPTHFKPKHTKPFCAQLFELIRSVEEEWTKPPPRQRYTWPKQDECWARPEDMTDWPVLARYLRSIQFIHSERSSNRAILTSGYAGSSHPKDAIAQLIRTIDRKMHGYKWPTDEDVRLLVFYDEAWRHNSPACDDLAVNAECAARHLRKVTVPFKRLYLLFGRSGYAYELHPEPKRCT